MSRTFCKQLKYATVHHSIELWTQSQNEETIIFQPVTHVELSSRSAL
jgi:hypothetical protein